MRLNSLAKTLAAIPALAALAPVHAQCPNWIATPSRHMLLRGITDALAVYTPPGETIPRIYIGGSALQYQGNSIGNMGQWNGFNFSSVGNPGPNGYVSSLVVWNSPSGPVLVAGGEFYHATPGAAWVNSLAAWNGTSWSNVGNGVSRNHPSGPLEGFVTALGVWDPDGPGPLGQRLVVGGNFHYAGNQVPNTRNIAAWDGSNWHSFGLGIDQPSIISITSWDPDGAGPQVPQLVVGGGFTSASNVICNGIARWANGSWWAMAGGLGNGSLNPVVEATISWDPDGSGPLNPQLVVGGRFTHAGGQPAAGLAVWNGSSWTTLGTAPESRIYGLGIWDPDGSGPDIPRLIASGVFTGPGGGPSPRLWNGSTWQPLGDYGPSNRVVFGSWDPDGAGPQQPRLVAGGFGMSRQTPTGWANDVGQLVGNEWHAFGPVPQIFAATTFGGRVIMGGSFDMVASGSASGGFNRARNLAAWSGTSITSLGDVPGAVRALKSYSTPGINGGSHLIVGGAFASAGGISAVSIARYTEAIIAGNSGWFPMGAGFNSTVTAIERFNSATYAGGVFTSSGTTAVNRVARFDGTNWQPLGSGTNGTVHALRSFNGSLYAGGSFTTAGGISTGGLARWDGTNWHAVGGFFNGTVYALEVWNGVLVIGGSFAGLAGSPNIAAYNGSSYFNLGSGGTGSTSTPVRALAVGPDGHLYIGGHFSTAGGVGAGNVARWNGSTWSEVFGSVTGGAVHALASYRNELHVGGEITKARWTELLAPAWARFTVDGVPWIALQPQNTTARCVGSTVELTPLPAAGYTHVGPTVYTWRKDGQPITFGLTPWGSNRIDRLYWLEIANVQMQDEGLYELTVQNGCGSVTTTAVMIRVCYANCDCSSNVPRLNIDDFTCYINGFAQGQALPHAQQIYHYANCDGSTTAPVLNIDDFSCFINAFALGCP